MSYFCKCGAIVGDDTKCQRCHRGRMTAAQKGYDYQWRKFREQVLDDQPLCVDCEKQGKVKPACELHHIQGIQVAPHLRLERTNVAPLCEKCHDARHGKILKRIRRYA